jgi:hypothetical protein
MQRRQQLHNHHQHQQLLLSHLEPESLPARIQGPEKASGVTILQGEGCRPLVAACPDWRPRQCCQVECLLPVLTGIRRFAFALQDEMVCCCRQRVWQDVWSLSLFCVATAKVPLLSRCCAQQCSGQIRWTPLWGVSLSLLLAGGCACC